MWFCLFAETEQTRELLPFLKENWHVLLPTALGFTAIYLLLPRGRRRKPLWAGVLAAVALVIGASVLIRMGTVSVESLLFFAFAGLAIVSGVMMITQKNPVHAALSFALVVLSTCGLFLLQAAPFLMAATIIIYAGAIVVTFLFVIMLAQQEGVSNADQLSREPFLASLAGCILLASLLCVLQRTYPADGLDEVVSQLEQLKDAKTEADVIAVLGDPKKTEVGESRRPLVEKLKKEFPDSAISEESNNLQMAWKKMDVPAVNEKSKFLLNQVQAHRQAQGSLALQKVPGKVANTAPSHFNPGTLPAENVAALGRTLFTDYLIAVELAATLLLVATIGAIAIAGRRSEELR